MIQDSLINLCENLKCDYRLNELLSRHTTFKIGGKADIYITADTPQALSEIINCCNSNSLPYYILGNGSNTLFSDEGFCGAVITLGGDFKKISLISPTEIECGAGAMLVSVCSFARDNGLTGMEELYGIPGTVGGAVFMNAGAYGGETAFVVTSVTALDKKSGKIMIFDNKECDFGYRKSVFMDGGYVIMSVKLKLSHGDISEITAKTEDYMARRKSKQPLEYPSAGSVFKRPEGYFAGALIEQCGLKGYAVGGAQVSEKHAGFIINKGGAKCSDVMSLVEHIKKQVLDKFGVELECEIRPVNSMK